MAPISLSSISWFERQPKHIVKGFKILFFEMCFSSEVDLWFLKLWNLTGMAKEHFIQAIVGCRWRCTCVGHRVKTKRKVYELVFQPTKAAPECIFFLLDSAVDQPQCQETLGTPFIDQATACSHAVNALKSWWLGPINNQCFEKPFQDKLGNKVMVKISNLWPNQLHFEKKVSRILLLLGLA